MHTQAQSKPVIGIVGGVGAGKSTVAAELAAIGCAVIDADAIGHELLRSGGVIRALRRHWGDRIFAADGAVNRGALGDIVFADPAELDALNRILHPRIRRRIERRIAAARADRKVKAVVLDAAVLLEGGWDDLCTRLVFVDAPARERSRRAAAARGWDRRTWRDREKSQISLDKKRRRCDHTIDNSSSASHLGERVRLMFQAILEDVDPTS